MKLYYFPIAPNPTKVRVYLAEKGIQVDEVVVDFRQQEQRSEQHLARNPLGKLPVLELDDGSHLTESLVIMELFEELHPEPPMIGGDPYERARVRRLERIADLGVLLPVGRIIHATKSPLGYPPNPEVAAAERKALPNALAVLNDDLSDRPFVAGDQPTIADCTLFSAFTFAQFGDVEIDVQFANLHEWFGRFRERPSAERITAPI
jgi:glutathione S-transferase|tara:strand:- start:1847 stop:2464 length:618 start_codon:yes stop_codon:yes gene_type:complete